jgi:hypothetical protein
MDIKKLPRNPKGDVALNPLVFTDIDDSPDNQRLGLGYHQLYDRTVRVGLIALLPDVTRVRDTIILYWDSRNVQQYDLDQGTIDKGWLSFGVSPDIIKDPQGEVYYTLYDNEAQDLRTSDTRTIRVNRMVPGGLDPDTGSAVNENLQPCTVTPEVVNSPDQPVTVTVPLWTNQELDDELTVMWNNIRVVHPAVTIIGSQDVSIPKEVLEQGGSSDALLVNYEIRDIVNNYSLVSKPTYVLVEIDRDALRGPRVVEADRTTLVLDLVALGDNDVHVAIPSYIGNDNPYSVTLSWIGKTPTTVIELRLPPQQVDDPSFESAQFTVPNADIKNIAGGSAVVRYSLEQDGVPGVKKSKTTSITITGLPVKLAKPLVDEANGGDVIDLTEITGPTVTVSIAAFLGQSPGDKVLLKWAGTPLQGAPIIYVAEYEIRGGEETKPTTFVVERRNLDPLAGGTLALTYQVVFKATGISQDSPLSSYTVESLAVGPVRGDESFEAQNLHALPLGVRIAFANNLNVTVVANDLGTAIVSPGIVELGERALYCSAGNKIIFEFGGTISRFLLSHALTATSGNRLDFFDERGQLVQTAYLAMIPAGKTVAYENIGLDSPCVSCELTVDNQGTLLDNLIWF